MLSVAAVVPKSDGRPPKCVQPVSTALADERAMEWRVDHVSCAWPTEQAVLATLGEPEYDGTRSLLQVSAIEPRCPTHRTGPVQLGSSGLGALCWAENLHPCITADRDASIVGG